MIKENNQGSIEEKKKEMAENNKKPPYATSGKWDMLLDLFRRISPRKIDKKFIVDNKIATPPNASKVVDLAKWLNIIDDGGYVKEEIARKLKLSGEDREKFIKEKVESSYYDLINKVNLPEAKKDDVVNYFISEHGFGHAQSKDATGLFLYLCRKYDIPVSEELKKKTQTISGNHQTKKERKSSRKEKKEEQQNIGEGKVIITIRGPDNLYFPINIKNRDEIDSVIEEQIKPILEVVKLKLPDDNHQIKTNEEEPHT